MYDLELKGISALSVLTEQCKLEMYMQGTALYPEHTQPPQHVSQASLLLLDIKKSGVKAPGAFGDLILPAPPGGEKEVEHNKTCFKHLHFALRRT